jgi:hypothetical protein
MIVTRPKRNYIRRKKCLNESAKLIRSALGFINRARGTQMTTEEVERTALRHAASIEAVCWDPRTSTMTDNLYHGVMAQKTRQLCLALLCQNLPQGNALQILADLRILHVDEQGPANPKPRMPPVPFPMVRRRNEAGPNEHDAADYPIDTVPNLEFGEMARLRFDQQPDLSVEPEYHEHIKFDF